MTRKILVAVLGTLLVSGSVQALADTQSAPPGGDYQKVSKLVPLPDFIPGLGTLYVQPSTLPAGPFLGYDREGQLVNTVYMIPLADMQAQKKFTALDVGGKEVTSVDLYYNAGHPGVENPHYHVVLWHVGAKEAAKLLKK
ncbi:MAG: hypothetical protein WD942_03700 [Dehalococcoidia bacterium]